MTENNKKKIPPKDVPEALWAFTTKYLPNLFNHINSVPAVNLHDVPLNFPV